MKNRILVAYNIEITQNLVVGRTNCRSSNQAGTDATLLICGAPKPLASERSRKSDGESLDERPN